MKTMVVSWPKVTRSVIRIDEEKCNGCGECIPNCPEGALRIVDGKARMVSESLCDGLGACIGNCPRGAMTVEEREVEQYSEEMVMENVIQAGPIAIAEHLRHLKDHGEEEIHEQALEILAAKGVEVPDTPDPEEHCACPHSKPVHMPRTPPDEGDNNCKPCDTPQRSALQNWPVQIRLVPVGAPFLKNADMLLTADCVPFAYPEFHNQILEGKVLLVGCPKLDDAQAYIRKLAAIFRENTPRSLTCVHMEVPCCSGLVSIAKQALSESGEEIPLKTITITAQGEILR